jgi:formamidopyrimidine-DNA glycosylase
MPELPDVEGFRRYFARYAEGRLIRGVRARDAALVRNTNGPGLGRALAGRRFEKPSRRGKWLIAPAEGPTVLIHFGMTGLLHWTAAAGEPHPYDRIVFELDGGELRYRDMRKFGGVWLARSGVPLEDVTGPLGPDAMTVDREQLGELLSRRRGGIKAALMDQRLIAGIGNLLSDEVLWRARIHPSRRANGLSRRLLDSLSRELHYVIATSNRWARIPAEPGWLTGVRDKRGARCPRCGARLRRSTVAGRTACWCPRDQRKPA